MLMELLSFPIGKILGIIGDYVYGRQKIKKSEHEFQKTVEMYKYEHDKLSLVCELENSKLVLLNAKKNSPVLRNMIVGCMLILFVYVFVFSSVLFLGFIQNIPDHYSEEAYVGLTDAFVLMFSDSYHTITSVLLMYLGMSCKRQRI